MLLTLFSATTSAESQKNIFEVWGDFENKKYHESIPHKIRFHGTNAVASIANIGADGSSYSLSLILQRLLQTFVG